jgi:hypothetical protein
VLVCLAWTGFVGFGDVRTWGASDGATLTVGGCGGGLVSMDGVVGRTYVDGFLVGRRQQLAAVALVRLAWTGFVGF